MLKKLSLIISLLIVNVFAEDVSLQPITISAHNVMSENDAVDSSGRPDWTSSRKFSQTRVYLQKEEIGEVGLEQWVKIQKPRGEKNNVLYSEEVEIGLGHRMQLDLYQNYRQKPSEDNKMTSDSTSIELRYAFADWGVIPGNPTAYIEYIMANQASEQNRYEAKLLLGDSIGQKIHWGANYAYEKTMGGLQDLEQALTFGASYTLIDNKLSIGTEMKYEHVTANGEVAVNEVDVGPSIQWKPTSNTHLDFTPLFGVNKDSPVTEFWFIFGYDFNTSNSHSGYKPISGML